MATYLELVKAQKKGKVGLMVLKNHLYTNIIIVIFDSNILMLKLWTGREISEINKLFETTVFMLRVTIFPTNSPTV